MDDALFYDDHLTMLGLQSRSIDFTLAYTQARIDIEIYLDSQRDLWWKVKRETNMCYG